MRALRAESRVDRQDRLSDDTSASSECRRRLEHSTDGDLGTQLGQWGSEDFIGPFVF